MDTRNIFESTGYPEESDMGLGSYFVDKSYKVCIAHLIVFDRPKLEAIRWPIFAGYHQLLRGRLANR